MRNELGKKKRRIVFGDGSEFQRPGWEAELIEFKKSKLRMPHKLIRVAKPSSLSLSPSGNGAQSTTSSITGGVAESPAKSTKENKSPGGNTAAGLAAITPTAGGKGSKQGKREKDKDKSPERELPELVKEKPVEVAVTPAPAVAEGKTKGKGRTPKGTPTATPTKKEKESSDGTAANSTTTSAKVDKPTGKGKKTPKEKEPKLSKSKPAKGKKSGKGKPVLEPELHSDSSEEVEPNEPLVEHAVEVMKAATKRDAKGNQVSVGPGLTVPVISKQELSVSESKKPKGKKGKASSSASVTTTPGPGEKSEATWANAITPLIPTGEVPSPSSSTSTAANATPNSTVLPKKGRRNKFKSGFDFIRKKKKNATAPDGTPVPPPPKRVKAAAEKNVTVEDVQAEVCSWVLNKGLGETALHRAARLNYSHVAAWTLDTDYCQPNCKDNAGYTPLHKTCIKGKLEVAKVLLRYGANPSQAAPGGIRLLHEACENGHVELVRLLISYGADPIVATYGGQTPLELAENHEPVRLLLQQHINDVQGREDREWEFRGSGSWSEELHDNGFDVTDEPAPPSPQDRMELDGFEFEASEKPLPNLYRLKDHTAHFVLLNEVLTYLSQPRERVLKNLPGVEVMELNSNDFLEQAHCCALKGENFNFNAISELTLIKYDDRVRRMSAWRAVELNNA